jgi:predicted RNase H-like nuclease (RuvC/YqgF family)
MMTQTEQIPKDVGGVEVDRVFTSQASRQMAAGRAYDTTAEIEREQQALQSEMDAINTADTTMQARLAQLNNTVVGRTVETSKYRTICDEQSKLKKQLAVNANRRRAIRGELTRLRGLCGELRPEKQRTSGPMETLRKE